MVSEKKVEGKTVFTCDTCGFGYTKKETAEECENYCLENNSCSIKITKDAIYFPEKTKIPK